MHLLLGMKSQKTTRFDTTVIMDNLNNLWNQYKGKTSYYKVVLTDAGALYPYNISVESTSCDYNPFIKCIVYRTSGDKITKNDTFSIS